MQTTTHCRVFTTKLSNWGRIWEWGRLQWDFFSLPERWDLLQRAGYIAPGAPLQDACDLLSTRFDEMDDDTREILYRFRLFAVR